MAKLAQNLRNAVLEAAFEGRLTTRMPSDSDPIKTLEIIRQKKSEMIKAGHVRKEKLVGMENCPYDTPTGWCVASLQEICSLIADIDHNMPKASTPEEGVMFLSAKDLLDDGTINYTDNIKYISVSDYERLSKKAKPQKDDIIYSRIGAALGKARVVDTEKEFLVSYSCCVIRPIIMNNDYLRYYLESPGIYKHAHDAKQSIGVPDLGMREIKKYSVVIPSLEEQQRIVDRVDELMAKIDEFEVIENELEALKADFPEEMKEALLQAAMEGKLSRHISSDSCIPKIKTIDGDEPYDIPPEWLFTTVQEMCSICTGKKDANYGKEGGEYPFFTCAAKPIRCPNYSFDTQAVLLAGNGDLDNISKYHGKFEAYQRTYVVEPNEDLLLDYLFYAFKARWVRYNLDKTYGSAIPYVRIGNVKNFELPVPPIEEQQRIVDQLDALLPLCDDLEKLS